MHTEYQYAPSYIYCNPGASLGVCRNGALGFPGDDLILAQPCAPLYAATTTSSAVAPATAAAAGGKDTGSVGCNRDAIQLLEQHILRTNRFAASASPLSPSSRARSVERKGPAASGAGGLAGGGRALRSASARSRGMSVDRATPARVSDQYGALTSSVAGSLSLSAAAKASQNQCFLSSLANTVPAKPREPVLCKSCASGKPIVGAALRACFVDAKSLPKVNIDPLNALTQAQIFQANRAIYECMTQEKLPLDANGIPAKKLFNFFDSELVQKSNVMTGGKYGACLSHIQKEAAMGPLSFYGQGHHVLQQLKKHVKNDKASENFVNYLLAANQDRLARLKHYNDIEREKVGTLALDNHEQEVFDALHGFQDGDKNVINVKLIGEMLGAFEGLYNEKEEIKGWENSYKEFREQLRSLLENPQTRASIHHHVQTLITYNESLKKPKTDGKVGKLRLKPLPSKVVEGLKILESYSESDDAAKHMPP